MTKPRVYFIGNTHIDHTWLWNWTEGYDEVKASWQSVLERMDEFPEFVFTASSTLHYRWLEENEPALFAAIGKKIREGRWQITGGWVVQPDNNIPCGESFCRLGLYGQRYFREHFGRMARTGYCVDSFGHHGQLPQILKLQGMTGWLHFRPWPSELTLPVGPYRWRGIDGSEVVACRPPGWYCTDGVNFYARTDADVPAALRAYPETLYFFGVGDHGGGPTIRDLHSIREFQEKHPELECRHGDLDVFYARSARRKLPVVKGELQYCFRGCYTTSSTIKGLNRRSESRLAQAEWSASSAAMLAGAPYPAVELARAWDFVLSNQFHDVMGGTCTPSALEEAAFRYGAVLEATDRLRHFASKKITDRFERRAPKGFAESLAFGVLNSLSWDREAPLTVVARTPSWRMPVKAVVDGEGRPVDFQRVEATFGGAEERKGLLLTAAVPGGGAALYHVVAEGKPRRVATDLKVRETRMENSCWRLTLDSRRGTLRSIYDKRARRELVPRGRQANDLLVIADGGDTWGSGVVRFDKIAGRFAGATVRVLERGPLRARWLITRSYRKCTVQEWISLHRGSNRIDFELEMVWNDSLKAVKIALPFALEDAKATYEIPYGSIARPINGEENPLQRWVMLSGKGYRVGLAVDTIGGADVTPLKQGAEVRLTLLRSPPHGHYTTEKYAVGPGRAVVDQGGPRRARYVLVGGAGELGLPEIAAELAQPLQVTLEGAQKGSTRKPFALVGCEPRTVHVASLKRAEDGKGFIVRLVETRGKRTRAVVTGPKSFRAIRTVLRAFEIQSWRWRVGAKAVLCDLLEDGVT